SGDQEIDQRSGGRDPDVTLPGVDRVRNGVRFVKDGDSADGEQDDALRRNARPARYQSVAAQGGARILGGGFGAPHKDQQKQEGQVNADFDSEDTSKRDGPTAHRHAYQYSIYLDTE